MQVELQAYRSILGYVPRMYVDAMYNDQYIHHDTWPTSTACLLLYVHGYQENLTSEK